MSGKGFVHHIGQHLCYKGQRFRFAECNIYWTVNDFIPPATLGAPAPDGTIVQPSHFRVDDAYATAVMLGCNVIRQMAVGYGEPGTLYPVLGEPFNETAFLAMDYAIARAADFGLKIFWFLSNPYDSYPGFWTFFGNDFFTNTTTRNNWKTYVTTIINRINTINGLRYGDDPTILGWETGNEIPSSTAWTLDVSAFIKNLAPRQLVIDGRFIGTDIIPKTVDPAIFAAPNVDIISAHFYPSTLAALESTVASLADATNQAFIIGEYDWQNFVAGDDPLPDYLAAMLAEDRIDGAGWWSLISHDDNYGFAPDFVQRADMRYGDPAREPAITLLRNHHYALRGLSVPPYPTTTPHLPLITSQDGNTIAWRGSPCAKTYNIQRSNSPDSGFVEIVTGLTDFSPPWTDPSPPEGTNYYKVIPVNADGVVMTQAL